MWIEKCAQGLAGPVEPGLDCIRADLQHSCGLLGVQFFDVTKEQNGSVSPGKAIDGFPHEIACLPPLNQGVRRLFPLGRGGLEMTVLHELRKVGLDGLLGPSCAAPNLHERSVDHDAV